VWKQLSFGLIYNLYQQQIDLIYLLLTHNSQINFFELNTFLMKYLFTIYSNKKIVSLCLNLKTIFKICIEIFWGF
jgi:hypothetical protein